MEHMQTQKSNKDTFDACFQQKLAEVTINTKSTSPILSFFNITKFCYFCAEFVILGLILS